jgi:hypothetical protein
MEPGRIVLNKFRRRAIGGFMQHGISLVRLRPATEPIKDVHDALITADNAHINDVQTTIL